MATKSPPVWPVKVPTSCSSCLSGAEVLGGDGVGVGVGVEAITDHRPGDSIVSARKHLDIVTAYRQVGTYRRAAEMCGVTHKTVSRVVNLAGVAEQRTARPRN